MNGLGELLTTEAPQHGRVVDLFCGGSSVAWYVAQTCASKVIATDLQDYAVALANAVIGRTAVIDWEKLRVSWATTIEKQRSEHPCWKPAMETGQGRVNTATWSRRAKLLCETDKGTGLIWSAYGGYYFSPAQAATLDLLLDNLPTADAERAVCKAALIIAASQCAASPGHTAQPFKPTRTAAEFLREAWLRDPIDYVSAALKDICPRHAKSLGSAFTGDAVKVAGDLEEGDLVFVDPPYSGVHYSRFYHVLETIARESCGEVSGEGRYPPQAERPASAFSRKTESLHALEVLLKALSDVGTSVILTFPEGKCSNGLSGYRVLKTAKEYFSVSKKTVGGRFSTLGGNNCHRVARKRSREMILLMKPK